MALKPSSSGNPVTRAQQSQHQRMANYGTLRRSSCFLAVSPALAAHLAGELPPQLPLPSSTALLSVKVYRVKSLPPTAKRRVAAVSRAAYDKAGVILPPVAGDANGRVEQRRIGGRKGQGGRPIDTRRDTLKTLGVGNLELCVMPSCGAVLTCASGACTLPPRRPRSRRSWPPC